MDRPATLSRTHWAGRRKPQYPCATCLKVHNSGIVPLQEAPPMAKVKQLTISVENRPGTLEQFELENKPGTLAELAGKLAKKGINIDSAYVTVPKGAKKALVLLATSSVANRL